MSNETKCPLTISDWIHYLNARASERAYFLFTRKTFDLSKIMIFIASFTIIFVGVISAINVLEFEKIFSYILILFFSLLIFILINIERYKRIKEFKKFEDACDEYTVLVDTIITKIMDNVLKTSEQIRDEWKKTIEDYTEKYY